MIGSLLLVASVASASDELVGTLDSNSSLMISTVCAGYGVFQGQDLLGNVISFSVTATGEDCCANCNADSDCTAWSWKSFQGNSCSMLSSVFLTWPSIGTVAGKAIPTTTLGTTTTTTEAPAVCDSYDTSDGKGLIGRPLKTKKMVSDQEDCCQYCDDTDDCYAWELVFGKWCSLHDKNNARQHPKLKSIIGIKSSMNMLV